VDLVLRTDYCDAWLDKAERSGRRQLLEAAPALAETTSMASLSERTSRFVGIAHRARRAFWCRHAAIQTLHLPPLGGFT
jgi:hypothetical protein